MGNYLIFKNFDMFRIILCKCRFVQLRKLLWSIRSAIYTDEEDGTVPAVKSIYIWSVC